MTGKVSCDQSRIVYEVTCLKCFKPCTFDGNFEPNQDRYSSNCNSTKKNEFVGLMSALEDVLGGNADGYKASYFGTSGHSGHKM